MTKIHKIGFGLTVECPCTGRAFDVIIQEEMDYYICPYCEREHRIEIHAEVKDTLVKQEKIVGCLETDRHKNGKATGNGYSQACIRR